MCQRCHLGQSASAFTKDSSRPDGLQVWCKACRSNARQETKAAKQQLGPLVSHKTCRRCGEEKTAAEFVRNAAAVDGLHHSCKVCHRVGPAGSFETDMPCCLPGLVGVDSTTLR